MNVKVARYLISEVIIQVIKQKTSKHNGQCLLFRSASVLSTFIGRVLPINVLSSVLAKHLNDRCEYTVRILVRTSSFRKLEQYTPVPFLNSALYNRESICAVMRKSQGLRAGISLKKF